jgi:beta-mannanase
MRAVPGAHFLFDWNINAYYQDFPLADIYPGNAYVDIIGIDQYDGSGDSNLPASGIARWNYLENEADGLATVAAFATANNKPMSIPEWGTSSAAQPAGGGDDGTYVTELANFVNSHDVAYQSYFDANDDNILPLDPTVAPNTVSAYVAAFK